MVDPRVATGGQHDARDQDDRRGGARTQVLPITIHGDGKQTRSFSYVDDEVRGLLALLDSDYVGPVNIGNPTEYTVLELAEKVLALTGSSSELRFDPRPVDDPAQRRPDLALARSVLGWEPEIGLDEGLARTARWFAGEGDG